MAVSLGREHTTARAIPIAHMRDEPSVSFAFSIALYVERFRKRCSITNARISVV
jgi:hypothetical protein